MSLWVSGSYLGHDVLGSISYKGADQPVIDPDLILGHHTFGDFYQPWTWTATANPWTTLSPPTNYPPAATVIFQLLAPISPRPGVWVYLLAVAVAMFAPMVWATRRWIAPARVGMTALVLVTVPFTVVMDRGNMVGLLTPCLLLFALGYSRRRLGWLTLALTLLASLKLYPAVLGVALLRRRLWLALVASGIATVGLAILVWAFYPGPLREEVLGLVNSLTSFAAAEGDLSSSLSYSLTSSLVLILGPASGVGGWILAHPWVPGVTYVVAIGGLFAVRPAPSLVRMTLLLASVQLVVPTSFRYTTVFALVAVALLVHDARVAEGAPEFALPEGRFATTQTWGWIIAIAVTLVPLPSLTGSTQPAQWILAPAWLTLLLLAWLGAWDETRHPADKGPVALAQVSGN